MIWYPWQNGNIRGFFHYNPIIIPLTHHDKTETSGPCLDDLRKAQRLPRASTNCCAPKLGRLGPDQETQVQWQTKLTPWVSISRQRFNSWGIHGYSVWLYNCYCILCVIIDCFLNGFPQLLREFPNSVTSLNRLPGRAQARWKTCLHSGSSTTSAVKWQMFPSVPHKSHINATRHHSSIQNSKLHGMGQNHAKPHSYHIWVNKHPLTNYSNNSHIIPRNIIFVVAENCIPMWPICHKKASHWHVRSLGKVTKA